MGAKITIDSATLMNKGLELIEAVWLFGLPEDKIQIVVQRESIVHPAVQFADHSVIAQLGVPDMRIPIQYALTWPDRLPSPVPELDFAALKHLSFDVADDETFRCLAAAKKAIRKGGLGPCAANGANEEAVRLFLQDKIGFLDIGRLVEGMVDSDSFGGDYTLQDVYDCDRMARDYVKKPMCNPFCAGHLAARLSKFPVSEVLMNFLLTAIVAVLVFGTVVLVHEAGHFFLLPGTAASMWRNFPSGSARRCGAPSGAAPVIPCVCCRWAVTITLPVKPRKNLRTRTSRSGQNLRKSRMLPLLLCILLYDPHAPLFPLTVDGKSFVEASPWQRFFVIAAGALMNFVLGFILLLVLVASGSAVTSKIIYDFQGENPKSQASGLQVNDEIMSVNRHFCFTAEDVMYELQRTENDTATITVLRDGKLVTLPQVQFDSTTNADGTTSMVLDFRVYGIEKTPRSVVHGAARYFCYYARVILRGFLDLFTGRVGVNELSGPVGIVNAVNEAVKYGWRDVLSLAAVITVNLGVFNLLPIPGLDGCKLLFLAAEGITRRELPLRFPDSHQRGRHDPAFNDGGADHDAGCGKNIFFDLKRKPQQPR